MDQKVGGTRLIRAFKLEKELNISSIFIKIEQDNPTHTHKDRASFFIINDAKTKDYKDVAVGTCGNYGVSIAYFCKKYGLNSHLFIPENYSILRLNEMNKLNANITYTKGTYEDAVEISSKFAKSNKVYDANPHKLGAKLAILSYQELSQEIYKVIGIIPETIWIPVGNGTLLTGIYEGFVKIGKSPKLGAVSSKANNVIIESFIHNMRVDIKPDDLCETEFNEPLLNWKPTQLKESLIALNDSNGFAYGATDNELLDAKKLLEKHEGIITTPASASAFAGFIKYIRQLPNNSVHVIILTS